jgi:hypothetical protein
MAKANRKEKERINVSRALERLLEHLNDYHHVIYLPVSQERLQADGMRIHTDLFDIQDVDRRIHGFFSIYNISYHAVQGTLEESIEQCCKIIGV